MRSPPCVTMIRAVATRHLRTLNDELETALLLLDANRRELLRLNATLALQATTDALTGLKNRMVLHNSLAEMIAVADRQTAPLSLLLVDVDHFKRINDTFGHLAGDRVLKSIATALRDIVREHDVVARFGGEEFALLLPDTALEEAIVVAESLPLPREARGPEHGGRRGPDDADVGRSRTRTQFVASSSATMRA
jgi:PleD family two-component response regulator